MRNHDPRSVVRADGGRSSGTAETQQEEEEQQEEQQEEAQGEGEQEPAPDGSTRLMGAS